jgi:hypothetical protein
VDTNQLDIALAIPLVEQIVRNESNMLTWNDVDIWYVVFELIVQTNSLTLPTAFEKAVFNMLLRSSLAS